MAADEALLAEAAQTGFPVLRLYRWDRPTLSFGYFMPWAQAAAAAHPGETLIRRWTGGGLVHHAGSFTWTLAVPRSHPFCALRPAASYAVLHEALSDCLVRHGRFAGLTVVPPGSAAPAGGLCADHPAPGDLLQHGRKIAGAGQRRTRLGLLHQAVILRPEETLGASFASHFASTLSSGPETLPTGPDHSGFPGKASAGFSPDPEWFLARYRAPDWNTFR